MAKRLTICIIDNNGDGCECGADGGALGLLYRLLSKPQQECARFSAIQQLISFCTTHKTMDQPNNNNNISSQVREQVATKPQKKVNEKIDCPKSGFIHSTKIVIHMLVKCLIFTILLKAETIIYHFTEHY